MSFQGSNDTCCMENNHLPSKSHVELEDNSIDQRPQCLPTHFLDLLKAFHCSLADGDWVALSSPAMKVEALSDLESPSDLSMENSENAPSEKCVDSMALSYESLKSRSTNPASGIDPTKREV